MTTNGQAPFITEFLYLNEAKNDRERDDLAMIIEETLIQRTRVLEMSKVYGLHQPFLKSFMFLKRIMLKKALNISI